MTENHLGKVIDGRYQLDRLLGEGASGAVYAATQLSVDRTVAVKLLHSDDTPGFAERFQAEARAIGKLNHTNILTLHDFGYDDDIDAHFMVTEYADGVPLSERMKEVMSTELILKVALEVASAMHHAHAQGILHRDLKPENVMLTRADGRVDVAKVLDFGLAEVIDPTSDTPRESSEGSTVSAGKSAPSLMELSQELDPYGDEPDDGPDEADGSDAEDAEDAASAMGAAGNEPDTAILPPVDLNTQAPEEVQRAIDAQFENGSADADPASEPGDEDE